LLRFSTAIAVVVFTVFPTLAMGGAGTTTDSSDNHRPPELYSAPTMLRTEYQLALHLIQHKQYAEAIPHLESALADKPQDTNALNYLGYAKSMVADYDSALYYYQRALAIDPNHRGVHENLGQLYLAKNDLASAQKELATLATLCASGCDERDTLAKAIADYKPTVTPTPSAATSPAATTSAPGG
jgi:Tfp pilus assembly protein PilF